MPIISQIGRKSPRVRMLREGIFVVLLAGALTMVYPFLLMLAGSTKSTVDARENAVLPRFLVDDTILYRKHVEALFDERLENLKSAYDEDVVSFAKLEPPSTPSAGLVAEWRTFLASNPPPAHAYALGHLFAPMSRTQPLNLRLFKRQLSAECDGDLAALNRAYETEFADWTAFMVMSEDFLSRRIRLVDTPFKRAFAEFKTRQPERWRSYFLADGAYRHGFLRMLYTRDITNYNAAHGTRHESYAPVRLTQRVPDGTAAERKDWEDYVRHTLNILWIRADASCTAPFRAFLEARHGSLATLNRLYGTAFTSFAEVPLPEVTPRGGMALADWEAFIAGWTDPASGQTFRAPVESLRIENTVFTFRDWLRARHGTVSNLNITAGTGFATFEDVRPPLKDSHYLDFLAHRGQLRREFAFRNYAAVLDFLLVHGRGMRNTAIYCLLSMATALFFNPLAAYALSRYRPPSRYKVLLFLLLTMAFPPMVTQIPVFLMLRDLNLLNTFAALVLPGLTNGYAIFLLKGFFDSLPRELYESASIDGASEWTMFWSLTMSLSKPILSVIALHAFTAAYSSFLFALLICQDEKMWTLMVWLYQLQQRSGTGVVYASLILAALPTFLVFAFCQKIILRGIVVPVEK